MGRTRSREELEEDYERSAQEYCASLPLEHFMEAAAQAFQRLIFVTAFRMIFGLRPDIQAFNELLIQYDHGRPKKRRRVVPDNMVVVHHEEIIANGSFAVLLQPAAPFLVAEYVSTGNARKDYEASYKKYEKELKVPYFLRFYPDTQDLSLFRHTGRRYVSVTPDERGRYAIPELEVELALVDGWVRFWFRGEQMGLPDEVRAEREAMRQERDEALLREKRQQEEIDRLRLALERRGSAP